MTTKKETINHEITPEILIDIDNIIWGKLIVVSRGKVIVKNNIDRRYNNEWRKEYKKLGYPKIHQKIAS